STSPFWIGARGRFRDLDSWVSRYLDPGEFWHWLEHHALAASVFVVALLLALYALSGLRIVAPDEVAVVRHFGRISEDLPPGWHWRSRWRVADGTRVSQRGQVAEIGFRTASGKDRPAGALTWASAHRRENRVPDEAMMITGDGNLVDLLVSVRYTVTDPR